MACRNGYSRIREDEKPDIFRSDSPPAPHIIQGISHDSERKVGHCPPSFVLIPIRNTRRLTSEPGFASPLATDMERMILLIRGYTAPVHGGQITGYRNHTVSGWTFL